MTKKHLEQVIRCPTKGCKGKLQLPNTPFGKRIGGNIGDIPAVCRCTKCFVKFTIDNPNSVPSWFETPNRK